MTAPASVPGQNGKIVFTSARDGNYEVYAMNADGSGQLNLTANAAADMFPSVSPAGDRVAFTSFRDGGNAEIYVMNIDGTAQTRLTTNAAIDAQPAWSPDGAQLAFRTDRTGDWEIYVMGSDGSGQANITNSTGVDDAPAWSPDGGRIVFETVRDGNGEVYVMNSDGSGQTNLSTNSAQDREPSWSPDGQRIAFRSDRDGNDEIYSMAADGSSPARLTTTTGTDSEPAWSPDGTKIAFRSYRDGNSEVYVMSSTGAAPTRLTTPSQFDGHPDWQAVVPGYPRPKSASPIKASLVPAYDQCASPTRTHGPPLAFPSCNPPVQSSPHLTVGSPDANGAPAASSGFIRHAVKVGVPGPPDDSDDEISFSLTDVRCRISIATCAGGSLSDYTGEVEVTTDIRVTDRDNAVSPGGGTEAATGSDTAFAFTAPCAATATSDGGRCSLTTSLNALLPGFVHDGKRMILQFAQVQVTDGGSDGLAATTPNRLFAVQGIFVP